MTMSEAVANGDHPERLDAQLANSPGGCVETFESSQIVRLLFFSFRFHNDPAIVVAHTPSDFFKML